MVIYVLSIIVANTRNEKFIVKKINQSLFDQFGRIIKFKSVTLGRSVVVIIIPEERSKDVFVPSFIKLFQGVCKL